MKKSGFYPLSRDWNIVTAFGEQCRGSGWSNDIIWVVMQKAGSNTYILESIQPNEQTQTMKVLLEITAKTSDLMVRSVSEIIAERYACQEGDKK